MSGAHPQSGSTPPDSSSDWHSYAAADLDSGNAELALGLYRHRRYRDLSGHWSGFRFINRRV